MSSVPLNSGMSSTIINKNAFIIVALQIFRDMHEILRVNKRKDHLAFEAQVQVLQLSFLNLIIFFHNPDQGSPSTLGENMKKSI